MKNKTLNTQYSLIPKNDVSSSCGCDRVAIIVIIIIAVNSCYPFNRLNRSLKSVLQPFAHLILKILKRMARAKIQRITTLGQVEIHTQQGLRGMFFMNQILQADEGRLGSARGVTGSQKIPPML